MFETKFMDPSKQRYEKYDSITLNNGAFKKCYQELGKEILEPIKFSTGGMRGIMREGFNGINEVTCNILGTELSRRFDSIVIGYDNRHNSEQFALMVYAIFSLQHKRAIVYKHTITPHLASLVQLSKVECGLMITASHNPKEYNGFKVYSSHGAQISPPTDQEIFDEMLKCRFTNFLSEEELKPLISDPDLKSYCDGLFAGWPEKALKIFEIQNCRRKVSFTGLKGVSGKYVKYCLKHFKLESCLDKYVQCDPDPNFLDLPFPNPEIEDVWREAKASSKADIILACDPDGDRFGLCVRVEGMWIHYNGNEIAHLFIYFFLKHFEHSDLAFINTFLCDDFMQAISLHYNILYSKSETGFKNVSREISKVKGKHVFAYEDSLGFLFGSGYEKDGVKCVLLMVAILQHYSIEEITENNRIYGTHASYNYQFRCDNTKSVLEKYLLRCHNLNVVEERNTLQFQDYRVILRVSGTEPIIKIYSCSNKIEKGKLTDNVMKIVADLNELTRSG